MSATRAVWIFLFVLTCIRLALLGTTDLSGDEAHYWMWSERLAPAYFSKGPGVAFAIRASTEIFGATEFGVRFWSPLLSAGTSLLIFYFARRLFSATAGLWLVLALNTTPIFNIGSFVMTIDPLSIFFWTAAMFTFWCAVERSPRWSWHWPATGLLIGIGFLCKYTNALELASIVIVLLLVPRLRREFKRPGLYLLLGMFAICMLPPIIWNQQHAWITLFHLRDRGGLETAPGFHPFELLIFLFEHLATYSPLLFLALVLAVIASWRRVRQQFKTLYLFWFGMPVFAFYLLLSFNKAAAPNWDALAFVSFGLIAVGYWREKLEGRLGLQHAFAAACLVGIAMSVVALDTDLLRSVGVVLRRDHSNQLRGWKSATDAIENVRSDVETRLGQSVFLIADERDRASEISFYLKNKRAESPGHPPVYIVESQDMRNQFSFWPRYDEFVERPAASPQEKSEVYTEENGVNPFEGRTALYIQDSGREHPPHNIRAAFQSTERMTRIEVRRFGQRVRSLDVFLCRTYRTLPL